MIARVGLARPQHGELRDVGELAVAEEALLFGELGRELGVAGPCKLGGEAEAVPVQEGAHDAGVGLDLGPTLVVKGARERASARRRRGWVPVHTTTRPRGSPPRQARGGPPCPGAA